MNILLYDIGSYIQKDLIYYLKKRGCNCRNVLYKPVGTYQDDFFERKFSELLDSSSYDFVMSTNFWPIVARICHLKNIKYLSWSYDSPVNTDHIEYYQFPTSYIFLFDRIETERVLSLGGKNIYHLPLGVNAERADKISISVEDFERFSAEISFVGQFYKNPLLQLMAPQNDFDKGYIDAIAEAQLKVYGYDFIGESLPDELILRMDQCLKNNGIIVENFTKSKLIHSISNSITRTERLILLNILGRSHQINYYSTEKPESLSHLNYCGTAYYFTDMPKIFKLSKLNLNPTLKNIQSGIPLRALDILSYGGTLFSNYQLELAEYFTDGQDVIMYESIEDAICKADFYLKHEDKRRQLTLNGYQKAITCFSYPEKITYMLKTAGII